MRMGAARPCSRITMNRSESRLSFRPLFLSLIGLSRLAPAVGAAGVCRASQVPSLIFGARHALRPRQTFGDLTMRGLFGVGIGLNDTLAACI